MYHGCFTLVKHFVKKNFRGTEMADKKEALGFSQGLQGMSFPRRSATALTDGVIL